MRVEAAFTGDHACFFCSLIPRKCLPKTNIYSIHLAGGNNLGATYAVHLKLVGKVSGQLVIIQTGQQVNWSPVLRLRRYERILY